MRVACLGLIFGSGLVPAGRGFMVQRIGRVHISGVKPQEQYSVNSARLFGSNPDFVDSDFEGLQHLKQEFSMLVGGGKKSGGSSKLNYKRFMAWEEIQALLSDKLCSVDEIEDIWRKGGRVDSINDPVDFDGFVEINRQLDDLFVYEDDREGEDDMSAAVTGSLIDDDYEEGEMTSIDVWNPTFNPQEALEPEFVLHLKQFFDAHSRKSPPFGLSFEVFSQWDEIRRMLIEGEVDQSCLKELWAEAIVETTRSFPDRALQTGKNVDFDTFLRLNIRLDQMLDELQEALESLSDEQVEEYYRKEFNELVAAAGAGAGKGGSSGGGGGGGGGLLSYSALMDWSDMREMITSGMIAKEEVDKLWDALPKQPLSAAQRGKGFGAGSERQADGIEIDAFLALNRAIEDEERTEAMGMGEGEGEGEETEILQ